MGNKMKNDKSAIFLIKQIVNESLSDINEAGHGGTIQPSRSTVPLLKHLDSYTEMRRKQKPTWEMLEQFLTKLARHMEPDSPVGGYMHLVSRAWDLLKGRYNPNSILSGETTALEAEKAVMKALGVEFKNAPKTQPMKIGTPDSGFAKIFGGVIESWYGLSPAATLSSEQEPEDPEIVGRSEKSVEPLYKKLYSRFFSK